MQPISAISTASAMARRGPGRSLDVGVWALGATLLGVAIGFGAGGGSTKLAAAVVVAPALAALLLRPDWLPVLLLITVFSEAVSLGGMTISRLTGPLAVLVLVLRLGLGGQPVRFPHKVILVAIGAYSAWALASVMWTVNLDLSFAEGGTAFALSSLVLSLAYLFAVAILIDDERRLRRAAFVIWGMSTAMGLLAIAQYLGGAGRSVGLSGDANFFAALQVIALPVGVVVATQLVSGSGRTVVLVGVGVIIGSIVTSLSRGGLLAFVAVFLLLLIQPARAFFRTRARKTAFVSVAAVGAAVLLALSFSALSQRTSSLSNGDTAGSGRTYLWDASLIAFRAHPLAGIGFGAFESQSNQLLLRTPGVDFSKYALRPSGQPVHNSYLESFAEMGVVGGALFLGLLLATLLTLRRAVREAAAQGELFLGALGRALQLSLLGFAFTSVFLSAETHRTLWVLLGLTLVLTRVLAAKRETASADVHR